MLDPAGNPILGLQPKDFVLGQGIRKARILSAEPMASTKALPVNLVLVIDNSFSMYERQAIQPLLAALDELLKDVRPIDTIHAVVFSDTETRAAGGRTLNVRTFRSNTFSELKAFFAGAFDRGITTKTYLNEAILAGLDIAKNMPANEQKLMMVFSDGEDLNSKYRIPEVTLEAGRIAKLGIYCIDYMPREQTDEFLAGLAGTHGGRIWKARSAAELVPIFQSFKSTILRRYVLTYELLNPIALEPKTLNFEVLATTTGAAASHMVFFFTGRSEIPDRYALFKDSAQADAFEPADLSGALNRYLNILNLVGHGLRHDPAAQVDIVGCTSETGVEQGELALSLRRAETVKDYLQKIWGIAADRMLIEARHLPGAPSDSESPVGRLENQRVEILVEPAAARSRIVGSLVAETRHRNEVSVNLDLFPLPDISAWELVIQGEDRPLKTVQGTGDVPPAFQIPLDELGRDQLARLSAIEAVIRVTDAKGQVHEAASDLCHIRTSDKELMKDLAFPPSGGGRPRAGHRHRRRDHHRGQRTPAQLCLLRHRPRRHPEPLCPLQQRSGTPGVRRAGAEGHPGKAPPGAQHHRPARRGPPPGAAAHHRLQLQLGRGKGQDRALTPPGRGRAGLPADGLGDRACPHGRGRARPARGRERRQHPRGPGREPARRDHLRRSGDSRHRPEHLHRSP